MEEKMKVQQENIKELLRLVQENPELRIVPMVDTLVDKLMFIEDLTEEEARNKVNNYDWEKVITVCIKPIG